MSVEITLPYRTDWREMSSVLDYCKGKGADRGALEARFGAGESLRETLNALEQLGLIDRSDSGDVRLTMAGEQLAYAPDQAMQRARLIEAMVGYPPYRYPFERAVADRLELMDGPWVEHIWQVDMRLGQPRNRVEEARTFFFRLADEAGLGTYRRGVRGQTTRLELAPTFARTLEPLLQRGVAPVAPRDVEPPTPAARSEAASAIVSQVPVSMSPRTPRPVESAGDVGRLGVDLPALGRGGAALSISVDMTEWDLEKIEAFLRLIGYLPDQRG